MAARVSELPMHNMVATKMNLQIDQYVWMIQSYLDNCKGDGSDGRGINERDADGLTALHFAVHKWNTKAVAALLLCGADVNVADCNGKTSYSYCLRVYNECPPFHARMLYLLTAHVHKLMHVGLRVSPENKRCYAEGQIHHSMNDYMLKSDYNHELDKMQRVVLNGPIRLRDVLVELKFHDIVTTKDTVRALDHAISRRNFDEEYPNLGCLIKMQYNRAAVRSTMINLGREAIGLTTDHNLPECCTENILRFLGDNDLVRIVGVKESPKEHTYRNKLR